MTLKDLKMASRKGGEGSSISSLPRLMISYYSLLHCIPFIVLIFSFFVIVFLSFNQPGLLDNWVTFLITTPTSLYAIDYHFLNSSYRLKILKCIQFHGQIYFVHTLLQTHIYLHKHEPLKSVNE